MKPSLITAVLIRLFALNWAIGSVPKIISYFTISSEYVDVSILPFIVYFSAAVIFWSFAPHLSKLLAKGFDDTVNGEGITSRQLYSCLFIGIGTYFALSSFGSTFNWVHFFATRHDTPMPFDFQKTPSFYDMSEPLLTLAASITIICLHGQLSRKLAGPS